MTSTNYVKALNTIKAMKESFGDNEFTRKDYNGIMKDHVSEYYTSPTFGETNKPLEYDIYSSARALEIDTNTSLVKKVREEDCWYKTDDDTKKKGKRYYYKVDTKAFKKIISWMLNDAVKETNECAAKVASKERNIDRTQKLIDTRDDKMNEKIAEITYKYKDQKERAEVRLTKAKEQLDDLHAKLDELTSTVNAMRDELSE